VQEKAKWGGVSVCNNIDKARPAIGDSRTDMGSKRGPTRGKREGIERLDFFKSGSKNGGGG